jgi:hypothetical protein
VLQFHFAALQPVLSGNGVRGTGVSRGVERCLQLLRILVHVPRARGEDVPAGAGELPWPMQGRLDHCTGEEANRR